MKPVNDELSSAFKSPDPSKPFQKRTYKLTDEDEARLITAKLKRLQGQEKIRFFEAFKKESFQVFLFFEKKKTGENVQKQ